MIIIDSNTVSVVATYTEPNTNIDGSALTDLSYTIVEYQVGSGPSSQKVLGPHVPASKPTGGGVINTTVVIPAPANANTTFVFDVFAVDAAGNRGPSSLTVTDTINRLGPAAPTGFTIA